MNEHGSFWIFLILAGIVQSCPSDYPYFFRRPGGQVEMTFTTTIDRNSIRNYQILNGDTLYVSITFLNGIINDKTEINCPKVNCKLSGDIANGNFVITLSDVQAATAGIFKFKENINGVIISCSTIFILGPPTSPTVSSNKDPSVGESAIVTCRSASTTIPSNHGLRLSFNWSIYGQTNPADPRYTYSASRHQITISNVRKTDSAIVMKCSAAEDVIDGYTSESSPFALNVVYGPDSSMINVTSPFIVTEGFMTTTIACTSDCWPGCINRWYNDTSNVIIGNKGTMSLGQPHRSQTGNYTCTAENTVAEYNKRTSITLGIIVHYPPEVHVDSKNATSDDKLAILKCIAKGVPDHYTYNNWDQQWLGSQLVRNWPSKGLSNLILEDLTYEHSGVYTCSASNGVTRFPNSMNNKQKSAYIFIKDGPVVLSPTLSKGETLVLPSKLGDTISVNITVFSNVGGIEASIERINGSFHPNTIRAVVTEKKVMLPVFGTLIEEDGYSVNVVIITENEREFSFYTVQIQNDFKQTRLLIDVRAEGPPTIPTQFEVSNVTQNAMETSWFAEFNGGFRQTFVLQISVDELYWSNASIVPEDIDAQNKINRQTISNLDHSTKYFLRMYAFNKLGTSGFSSVLQATTIDTQDKTSKGTLIGGIVGGCIAVVIAVLVTFLLWRRVHANPDEVKNPMYVAAEYTITQKQSSANATRLGGTGTKTTNDDLYAVVDKNNKTSGESDDCSRETNDKCQGNSKLINHEGLVYADVVFNKSANEQGQSTINGLEDTTEYAQIDLTITGIPTTRK